jgi:hypothetical protein
MQAIFLIEDLIDDAGVVTYKAMLPCDVGEDGYIDRSAPIAYGETAWEAITGLIELIDSNEFAAWLFEPHTPRRPGLNRATGAGVV